MLIEAHCHSLKMSSFEDVTRPHKASNLPGYTGYCPQLRFKYGRTYGADTDKLTKLHTNNEKLVTTRRTDPMMTTRHLPLPDGDNKLTENIVTGYTGYIPIHTPGFIFGSRYKESTEEAISKFLNTNDKQRAAQEDLQRTTSTSRSLRKCFDFQDPISYPNLNPVYGKNYRITDGREFTEAPIPGYTGFIPNIEQCALGQRYKKWTEDGLDEHVRTRLRQERLLTQRIDLTRPITAMPEGSTMLKEKPGFGTLYKKSGMLPKYTGYIPRSRFRFGNTYGNTTREAPACADPKGYAAGNYITLPVM